MNVDTAVDGFLMNEKVLDINVLHATMKLWILSELHCGAVVDL